MPEVSIVMHATLLKYQIAAKIIKEYIGGGICIAILPLRRVRLFHKMKPSVLALNISQCICMYVDENQI